MNNPRAEPVISRRRQHQRRERRSATKIRPETQRLMVQGDPHPIAKYRVVGPLSNMPEFQAAFSCKADAAMIRAADQRCSVW